MGGGEGPYTRGCSRFDDVITFFISPLPSKTSSDWLLELKLADALLVSDGPFLTLEVGLGTEVIVARRGHRRVLFFLSCLHLLVSPGHLNKIVGVCRI